MHTEASHYAKLFELILLDLCSDDLEFGFQSQSGCSHALLTFKETVRYFTMKDGKVYCAFFNVSGAFGKVIYNGLFVKLLKRNVSINFVRLFVVHQRACLECFL